MKKLFALDSGKELLIIFSVAFLLYIPVWILTRHQFFVLSTDFDPSLAMYHFFVEAVRVTGKFPAWNPYVGTGMPVLFDPTSVVNPILTPLMLFFGVEQGLRATLLMLYVLEGFAMWVFLRSLGVGGWLRVWGSILFMVSGVLSAYTRAGHVPELLTYPVMPLVFYVLMKQKIGYRDILGLSLLLAYMFYSGNMYMLWFTLICTAVIIGFYAFTGPRSTTVGLIKSYGLSGLMFLLFSFPKLYPFVTEVLPTMDRFFRIDPYKGSIHSIWFPFGWIVPFQTGFYDRPFFQRLFGFYYNWYEYYAFITPLPFLFLLSVRNLLHKVIVKICILLLVMGALYIALKYPYSPFYWIYKYFPFAQTFRVPQRMYAPLTVVMIALLTLCAREWFRTATVARIRAGLFLCVATILWAFFTTQYTLTKVFEKPRVNEKLLAQDLRRGDSGNYYVAIFVCCEQLFLVEQKIPILNFYYSWRPKGLPDFNKPDDSGANYDLLVRVRPTYVITPPTIDLTRYNYTKVKEYAHAITWKTGTPTIRPKIL